MNKLYTAQEVAERLKIKKNTVYELIKRGELASSKIGKQLRISEEQLSRYLSSSEETAKPPLPAANFQPESSLLKRDYLLHSSGLIISGQSSPALELLLSQLSLRSDSLPALQSHLNTYNGLYALYFGKVHVASASLKPRDISALVPGIPLSVLCLYEYPMGFFVKKGNPQNITCFEDLKREGVTFSNREKGSTRRIFLDRHLQALGISPGEISGYAKELVSDLATAAQVASGKADVALGEQYAAQLFPDLDFLPLASFPLYLVMEAAALSRPGFSALTEIVQSEDFKTVLHRQTGYDVSHTGEILYL